MYPDVVRSWGEEGGEEGGEDTEGAMWQASLHLLSFLDLHAKVEVKKGFMREGK